MVLQSKVTQSWKFVKHFRTIVNFQVKSADASKIKRLGENKGYVFSKALGQRL